MSRLEEEQSTEPDELISNVADVCARCGSALSDYLSVNYGEALVTDGDASKVLANPNGSVAAFSTASRVTSAIACNEDSSIRS